MPSHKSGSAKQKNKPFKGSSKHKSESKNFGLTVTKRIAKMEKPLPRNDRLNKLKQLRDNKMKEKDDYNVVNDSMLRDMFIELKHKMPGAPKIVLLAAFNDAAQPDLIKANLAQILAGSNEDLSNVNMKSGTTEGNVPHEFEYFRMPTSNKISPELKNDNYIFLTCPRNVETFLDYCKIADIVGIVLSCKNADQSSLLLDPFEHAKAFDEVGYAMLGAMKAQGFPTVVGVLQDLEQINSSKQTAVKKIFTRFFESEIGVDEKVVTLNNNDEKSYIHLMRVLQESQLKELEWRECRSYFLAEKLQVNPQTQILEIEGFLKGNYLNPNQLVHITGYGDYPVLQLDILHNPFMPNYRKQKLLEEITSFGFQPDDNRLASFQAEEGKMADYSMFPNQDTQGLKKIKETQEDGAPEETKEEEGFEEEVTMGEGNEGKPKMMDEGDEEMIADEQSDISFEENATQTGMLTEEKKELRQLTRRADDEKDFADEVEYPSDIKVRERYRKYKGLKSFKTTEWNPYDGLPAEYEKIFIFDDFNKSKKLAVQKAQKEAVAYKGFYVKIYISDFPIDNLANHNKERPIIVSTLLTHERKISVLNLKVKKQLESEQLLKSKENMEIHLGFRIFNSQPIFSKILSGTTKTKFEKKADKDQVYMASFYGETTYPPANALLFKTNEHGVKQLVASGELMKPDPLRVILKRIIFCGYPFKVHKRTAVVRMMFFNPEDVRNFQHIELTTKNGLRGYIKDSIGTHGYMKCIFSSPAKHSDTVCMNLYKRVFPAWPFEPVQPSVVGTDDLLSHQTH